MPKNLKKVQIYPNPVITLLEVNSLTLHNLHYIVLALCKAARPAQIKEKIEILVLLQGSLSPTSLTIGIIYFFTLYRVFFLTKYYVRSATYKSPAHLVQDLKNKKFALDFVAMTFSQIKKMQVVKNTRSDLI
jgi:hypothetical protein